MDVVDFLQKPVHVEQLATHVRQLLARGGGTPLRERTIAELMVPPAAYRRVYADQPLCEALEALQESSFPRASGEVTEHGRRCVLVFDREEEYVGLLRIPDVLRHLVPPFLPMSRHASCFTGMFLAQSKVVGQQRVGTMLHESLTIDVEAPLLEAVRLMVTRHVINLPVLSDGELVGVLRDRDLMLEAAGLVTSQPRPEEPPGP